jgi:hypothetical protein
MIVSTEAIREEKPGVPSPVAYRSMRSRQRERVKRSGQCNPPKGHVEPVRASRDLRASMRMGARLRGRTNGNELLINTVMNMQAKDAEWLGPKGTWPVDPLYDWDHTDNEGHRWIGRVYPTSVIQAEQGKPVSSPQGRRTVRNADDDAGKGMRRKRRPACSGSDRD